MRMPCRSAVLAASVLLAGAALAGCSGASAPNDRPVLNGRANGTVVPAADPHVVTADRGHLHAADLELASGVTTLVLRSGDLGGHLYQISTPAGAGVIPAAVTDDGQVTAQLSSSGTGGPSLVDVALSDAVVWTVHLDGGATVARIDMHAGGLATLDFGAGISRIDATVPGGVVTVRMSGGASEFDLHAPKGIPARVTMGGGGGSATIDGRQHSGITGGTVFAPADWPAGGARLDVDNTAGVSSFTLDRY